MKSNLIFLLTCILTITLLLGCKDDDDSDRYEPYYGTWHAVSCSSNGGPFNCGLPYPMPRDRKVLTLNPDRTYTQVEEGDTIKGTYEIVKAENPHALSYDKVNDDLILDGGNNKWAVSVENGKLSTISYGCCSAYSYVR